MCLKCCSYTNGNGIYSCTLYTQHNDVFIYNKRKPACISNGLSAIHFILGWIFQLLRLVWIRCIVVLNEKFFFEPRYDWRTRSFNVLFTSHLFVLFSFLLFIFLALSFIWQWNLLFVYATLSVAPATVLLSILQVPIYEQLRTSATSKQHQVSPE